MQYLAGIDIGGTKCAVVLGRNGISMAENPILDRVCFPTPKSAAEALEKIRQGLDMLLERHGCAQQLLSIGISCGGPLDCKKGLILNPPNLCGWGNVAIVSWLYERYNVPVFLQNDANACALAEWKFGAGKGTQNLIFLTFGTGMGAGIILGGRLYTGTNGMAGEIGHVRMEAYGPVGFGKTGSFEGFCSGGGIAQLARIKALEQLQAGLPCAFCPDLSALDCISAKTVALAAEAKDPLALEVYRICGEYLGRGLSVLIDVLNPQVIVLGSIYARSRELLWPQTESALQRETLPASLACCRILPAALAEQIGDYAALSVALAGVASEELYAYS